MLTMINLMPETHLCAKLRVMDIINSNKHYPSDLSDKQWRVLKPLVPINIGPGKPTQVDLRSVINAILYRTRTGCQWRYLPHNYPPLGTVYYYFRKWSLDGTWSCINEALRQQERVRVGRAPEPSGAIIDSQSVKTTEAGGERGFDAGKNVNGRKRHVMTDTLGNLLEVVVNAANTQDRDGAKAVIGKLKAQTIISIKKIWADGGYSGQPFMEWLHQTLKAVLEIAHRPPNAVGFVVVPVRWVVERTLAWLGRYRCLSKDYERCTKSSEGVIYVASIATMLNRLT